MSVKGSRFIATAGHANSAEIAKSFVEKVRAEFRDATQNCWAYAAGPPGDTREIGMSDDGEPHGTAGKPILNACLNCGIGEVAVVVTRYFGGTKLGTGGLVRAYSGAAKAVLDLLETVEKEEMIRIGIEVSHEHVPAILQLVSKLAGQVVEEQYEQNARLTVALPQEAEQSFRRSMLAETHGAAEFF